MKLKTALASVALAGCIAAVSTPAMARDTISIVGSSTVYPVRHRGCRAFWS